MWSWHNCGCVWGKVASECAGKEEWSIKRKRCQTADDKRDFITLALQSVKHATHRSRIGDTKKPSEDGKDPRHVEPLDTSIQIRTEEPTGQLCGDSIVAEKWINGHYVIVQKYKEIRRVQKTLHSGWKKKVAYPVTQIDDYVKHIFRGQSRGRPLGQLGSRRIEEDHC